MRSSLQPVNHLSDGAPSLLPPPPKHTHAVPPPPTQKSLPAGYGSLGGLGVGQYSCPLADRLQLSSIQQASISKHHSCTHA